MTTPGAPAAGLAGRPAAARAVARCSWSTRPRRRSPCAPTPTSARRTSTASTRTTGPLVLALRADRLGDLSTNPQFARLLERGLYLPGAMSEENLRAAVEGPARHAGLRLEPGLVDLLVREVDGEPGALPLLSHALRQTWELREGATLTVEGYRRSGGIRDAVAQSAESLYDGSRRTPAGARAGHVPAPGRARRRERTGADHGPAHQARAGRRAREADRAPGRRPAAQQRRGRRPDRPRGPGPGVAAAARLARRGRRGSADLPAPVGHRRGVGLDRASGRASSTAVSGSPARSTGPGGAAWS